MIYEPVAIACAVGLAVASFAVTPGKRIPLDNCVLVAPPKQPALVRYALEDLRQLLCDLTGHEVPVATTGSSGAATVIEVSGSGPATLGDEGYSLTSVAERGGTHIVASGASAMGTKYAIQSLMMRLRIAGKSVFIDGPLDVTSVPASHIRGMHLNGWTFRRPYSFRTWTEDDWRRYIDILSLQGVNLLYLWPFMEIIPVPLSTEDESYLREVRRLVAYAQTRHGMQVWLMQSANRVPTDDCGVKDPRYRPYWRPSQPDVNPGDSAQFERIMASREALYRIVNNADGVCTIDSDPGWCAGSPFSDFLKVLKGCRALLDRNNVHGKDAKIVYWMWQGWGRQGNEVCDPEYMTDTVRAMKSEMSGPWMLVAGLPQYLPLCKAEGVLDRTVYLPYSSIEDEPSYPGTDMGFGGINDTLGDAANFPGLAGVMGNVQCPLLQFPRVFDYLSIVWDPSYRRRPEHEVLAEISAALYPEQARLVADCFAALADGKRAAALAKKLGALVAENKLGRPGVFGRLVFPTTDLAARALCLQLNLRTAHDRMCDAVRPGASRETCARAVERLLDAYLEWDTDHGWHELWGHGSWQLGRLEDDRFHAAMAGLRQVLGDDRSVNTFFAGIRKKLEGKYDAAALDGDAIGPVRGRVLAAVVLTPTAAREATVTASAVPNPEKYPPSHANDGDISTLYWPGALTTDNTEWVQLTWTTPQTVRHVVAYFVRHDSMWRRTIHLQRQTAAGTWADIATTTPADSGAFAVARFDLAAPVSSDKLRIVNLLDLFEVEVR